MIAHYLYLVFTYICEQVEFDKLIYITNIFLTNLINILNSSIHFDIPCIMYVRFALSLQSYNNPP